MAHLNHDEFAEIQNTLNELNNPHILMLLEPSERVNIKKSIAILDQIKSNFAPGYLITKAIELHESDDLEVDDEFVSTTTGEGGTWVQAWVRIPEE